MTHSRQHLQRPTPGHDDEDEQSGYPVIEWLDGQPVPDLNEIPQDQWREVLIPLTKRVRTMAAYRLRTPEASRDAGILTVTLDLEDGDRRAQAESRVARPRRLPAPSVDETPGRPVSRQVNFRISATQHERLAQAAQRIGAKPGQLARLLTMRGVEHMLWEERSHG